VEQYNTESKVNYRKALEKIHINTEAQTKDKQSNNEVMMMMMMMLMMLIWSVICPSGDLEVRNPDFWTATPTGRGFLLPPMLR
jgi:hypothetical protein